MENKHKVFNLVILDESGSMQTIKKSIINGFNELVQTIKGLSKQFPEQEHYVTLISFNSREIKTILNNSSVENLQVIDELIYQPDAWTPLYDAMAIGIKQIENVIRKEGHYNVLVTVLTDGEENASKEFDAHAIKSLVEEKESKNWTFTYMGANHDVEGVASSLSIKNIMRFEANEGDVQRVFMHDRNSRIRYSENIRDNKNTNTGYFDTTEKPDVPKAENKEKPKKSFWKSIFRK